MTTRCVVGRATGRSLSELLVDVDPVTAASVPGLVRAAPDHPSPEASRPISAARSDPERA